MSSNASRGRKATANRIDTVIGTVSYGVSGFAFISADEISKNPRN